MAALALPSAFADSRLRRALVVAALLAFGVMWGAAVAYAGLGAALICISLLACVFCLRDFRWGVVLLILIMPISSSFLFPHSMFGISGLNPLNLLLAATLGSYTLAYAGKGALRALGSRPLVFLYIAPIVMGALLGMSHANEIPGIFVDMEWIEYVGPGGYLRDLLFKPMLLVLYAMLVGVAVGHSRTTKRFLTPMLVSMWVMALLVIVFIAASGVSLSQLAGTYERSFLSPLGMHANDLGRLYATAYALLLFIWDRTPRASLKAFLIVSMGLVAAALLLTFSRGAIVAFVIVNVIYLFSRRKLKTLILGAMLLPVVLALMPGAIWSRLDMGMGQGVNAVSAGRVSGIWAPLMPWAADSPIWGHGLQSLLWSPAMRGGHMLQVTHPHSAWLQAVLDTGFIGLILMLAFWMGHVWRGFRALARDPSLEPEVGGFFEGAAAGLLGIVIANVAGSSFFPVPEQSFLWLAVGLMYGLRLRARAAAGKA
ncbi:MAG TPA: O-antigen ligase family protein [Usitatibacter sp.]|jgi:O-antigen ligase|nr:O-antigen ligase family protein [Usitatibacter sp.]